MIGEGGWLGRLDSNQGMAESKSGGSTSNINAHSEKQAEIAPSNNNSLGADSERRAGDPKALASAPQSGQSVASRDFDRWLGAHAAELGPDLYAKALRVHLSLRTANQTAYQQSAALQALTKADLRAFTTAYADHAGARS